MGQKDRLRFGRSSRTAAGKAERESPFIILKCKWTITRSQECKSAQVRGLAIQRGSGIQPFRPIPRGVFRANPIKKSFVLFSACSDSVNQGRWGQWDLFESE